MRSKENNNADAEGFYNVVMTVEHKTPVNVASSKEIEKVDKIALINFVNTMLSEYSEELLNPMFDYLKEMKMEKINLDGIRVVTGLTDDIKVSLKRSTPAYE